MSNKVLLLRYSDFHGIDTIAAHMEIIQQYGRCWWAKIGKQPSPTYLQGFFEQEEKIALLYTSGVLYKCRIGSVLRSRPENHYPPYYDRDIFGKDNEPQVFFELLSIEEIELNYLDDYVVCSSGKEVLYDLKKTISSYMFIQHNSIPLPPKPERKPRQQKLKKAVIDKNSCVYKKDGMCGNRTCVNYRYECERPQYCLKQKPILVEVNEA